MCGLRVPASCVPYVPEAQGSSARGRHYRGTTVALPCVPRTVWCTPGTTRFLAAMLFGELVLWDLPCAIWIKALTLA